MKFKMLAVDLDGTLLDGSERISSRNLASLHRAHREGVKVVVATGRSYTTAESYVREIDTGHVSVTYNGALIRNGSSAMKTVALPPELTGDILKLLVGLGHSPLVYLSDERKYFERLDEYTGRFVSYVSGLEKQMVQAAGIADRTWDQVLRLTVVTSTDRVAALHDRLAMSFGPRIRTIDTYFPAQGLWTFEILDSGSSKSKGLEHLCSLYGIAREQVLAVGDNDNDIDMIEWAGFGVAMRNGLPGAIEAADYVTSLTNDEDGVSEVIDRFIMNGG